MALRHVRAFDLGSNLVPHALRVAQHTQTYFMLVEEVGPEVARTLVEEELEKAAKAAQDEWDLIVARSYLDHFSPEELESITREGRRSPSAPKLASERAGVQQSLDARGREFFVAFVGRALGRALERSRSRP